MLFQFNHFLIAWSGVVGPLLFSPWFKVVSSGMVADCPAETGTNNAICTTGTTLFESRISPRCVSTLESIIVSVDNIDYNVVGEED